MARLFIQVSVVILVCFNLFSAVLSIYNLFLSFIPLFFVFAELLFAILVQKTMLLQLFVLWEAGLVGPSGNLIVLVFRILMEDSITLIPLYLKISKL